MSLPFSGGPYTVVDGTYASASALLAAISTALQASNWSLIASGANWARLRSPLNAQGVRTQILMQDPVGTTVEFIIEYPSVSSASLVTNMPPGYTQIARSGACYIGWGSAAISWRVICSPAMLCVLAPATATGTALRFYHHSTIALRDIDVAAASGVAVTQQMNSIVSSGTLRDSWRLRLRCTTGSWIVMWGGMVGWGSLGVTSEGALQLVTPVSSLLSQCTTSGFRYADDSVDGPMEAVVAATVLPVSQYSVSDTRQLLKIFALGALWDHAIFMGAMPGDTTFVRDGVTWYPLTDNNVGVSGQTPAGTLCVRVA